MLEVLRPFVAVLPEVSKPERKVCGEGGDEPSCSRLNLCLGCLAVAGAINLLQLVLHSLTLMLSDPIQREGAMDCRHALHLSRVLPGGASFSK